MAHITEHNCEQERKGDDRIKGRIHFAITGRAVGINKILEATRKLVGAILNGKEII